MTGLEALWLPILLSAVAVFLLSFLLHMALPWHHGDYRRAPDEDRVMAALRPFAIPPGDYMMPRPASPKEMGSPEFVAKRKQGPVMIFTVMSGEDMSMAKPLILWFVYSLIVGIFAAYVAGCALPAGARCSEIFQFAGVTTFLAYAGALAQMSIWYRRSWATTIRSSVDGLVYALATAGIFAWLWPH